MAKMVTRTVTIYTYVTGTLNLATMTLENAKSHDFPYKLGQRQQKQLAKNAGNPIVATQTKEVLYGMSIDDFIVYGKPITDDEVPNEETDE